MANELRIGVVGAGRMGYDHIKRIHSTIKNAAVSAVIDIDEEKAQQAVQGIEGAQVFTNFETALEADAFDAVLIATPGFLHLPVLLPAIKKGLPILCEKPMTTDSVSSWEIVQAEVEAGKRLVQVGFMRRFDAGYQQIRSLVESREHGELLQLSCEHINPDVPASYTGRNLIDDTVVHEFDVIRFLTGEEIKNVQVRAGKKSKYASADLNDPAQVLIETEDGILVTVNTHVVAQYGYAVTTKGIFEERHVSVGEDQVCESFEPRFVDAYDAEVQAWVDASLAGTQVGPSAWDGYAAAACCEAGIEAEASGKIVEVSLNQKPDLYK